MDEYRLKPSAPSPVDAPKPDPIVESTTVEGDAKIPTDEIHSVEYFEFKGWGGILMNPDLDTFGNKEKIVFIEDFLRGQVEAQGLKSDRDTYHALLSEMEKTLQMSRFHDQNVRIQRVFKAFKAMSKSAYERRKIKGMIMKANEEAEKRKNAFTTRFGAV